MVVVALSAILVAINPASVVPAKNSKNAAERKPDMAEPVQYTNRKGKTYYLHAVRTKTGTTRYVMKRTCEGALTHVPEGYVITENVNGVVSVGRPRSRVITELEEARVVHALQELQLRYYRVEVKDVYLTIYEPIGQEEEEYLSLMEEMGMGVFPGLLEKNLASIMNRRPLEPVMRFRLFDPERRIFEVERMTYRGRGGWHSLGKFDTLAELTRTFLKHLGKDSFFELM